MKFNQNLFQFQYRALDIVVLIFKLLNEVYGYRGKILKNMKESAVEIFAHLNYKQEIITQFEKYFSLIVFSAISSLNLWKIKEFKESSPGLLDKKQQTFLTSIQ